MFSSTGIYGQIPCPEQERCGLINCIFLHQKDVGQRSWLNTVAEQPFIDPTPKRRKVTIEDSHATKPASQSYKPKQNVSFVGALVSRKCADSIEHPGGELHDGGLSGEDQLAMDPTSSLSSVKRPISPPPKRKKPATSQKLNTPAGAPKESLNPRRLQHDPAGHQKRVVYLKKLHEDMTRLNEEVKKKSDTGTQSLALDDAELIKLALDEEEKIARESPSVYTNVIKLRMVAYKNMSLEAWEKLRLDAIKKLQPTASDLKVAKDSVISDSRSLDSDLSDIDEVKIVRRLFSNQNGLAAHGYVTSPPSENDRHIAKQGTEAAQGWEQCERCRTRFQVYPDRREDGALTSGGRCTYHFGRPIRPKNDQIARATGAIETILSCCNESVGRSMGCVTADTHVFKIYDAKRLASVMEFARTPESVYILPSQAVTFDCEMGFTVKGFELIRLTALSWPQGTDLLDILVRPLGTVLDLNSRFSGVWPEDFTTALPYGLDSGNPEDDKEVTNIGGTESKRKPRIVDSPFMARELLFKLISPTTPLIGHAIENDLNAVRVVHPCIIDTILLFPHPRGLPYRMSLKALVKQHLWRDIQMSGAEGHDSREDAQATGDLVRLRVIREWNRMKIDGWTLQKGVIQKPLKVIQGAPKTTKVSEERRQGVKRPSPLQYDGAAEEEEEEEKTE